MSMWAKTSLVVTVAKTLPPRVPMSSFVKFKIKDLSRLLLDKTATTCDFIGTKTTKSYLLLNKRKGFYILISLKICCLKPITFMWWGEGWYLQKKILSFCHVGPKDPN